MPTEDNKGIIRVLIVEDSPLMAKTIEMILITDPSILVVGIVHDGREAVSAVASLKPDLVTMDLEMPVMDGLEATKQIMAYHPTPILVVSLSSSAGKSSQIFEAISYGALDFIDKKNLDLAQSKDLQKILIEKVKFLSRARVISHPLAKFEKVKIGKPLKVSSRRNMGRLVAIVVSTGGPQALLGILQSFPKDFPCGIVVVQHIISGFVAGLVEWLASQCQIKIKMAQDDELLRPGVVYVAPSDVHMKVQEGGKIKFSQEDLQSGHRPSGDVLLKSVAEIYGSGAIGVILTGMGRDGALGMQAISNRHGYTLAQDEKSCVVFGMPKAAIELGIVDKVLPLSKIAAEIVYLLEE